MSDDDLDRPEESASADVTLISRGVTITAHVEVSDTYVVVVRPTGGGPGWDSTAIEVGDAVELYWVGGQEERTLAGTVTQLEAGEDARWHLAVKGQAERSQRRKAVRARVEVPVIIPWAGGQMTGNTVDLSESGMRALMDGWGLPPEPGTPTQLSLDLGDALAPPARRVRVDVDPRRPVAPGHEVRSTCRRRPPTPCAGGCSRPSATSGPPRGADHRRRRSGSPGSVRAPRGALACRSPAGGADPGPQLLRDPVDPPPGAPT